MGHWLQVEGFNAPLETELQALADSDAYASFVSGIEATQVVVEQIAVVVNALGGLLSTGDPVSALLRVFSSQLDDLLNNVLNTGVGFFPILPKTAAGILHPFPTSVAMIDAATQASDYLDSERPQGSANSAYAGLVVLVGANRWADFRRLLEILDELFGEGRTKWGALAKLQLKVRDKSVIAREFRPSSGAPWDWSSFKLFDLPVMQDAFGPILALLERLSALSEGLGQVITDVANILAERLAYVTQLLDSINEILEFFKNLKAFMTEAYALPFAAATGGVGGAVDEWVNSSNEPDLQLVAGFILMAEGPNAAANVTNFMSVFGMEDERIQRVMDQAEADIQAIQAEADA